MSSTFFAYARNGFKEDKARLLASRAALAGRLRDAAMAAQTAPAEPLAWIRQHPDGTLTNEVLPNWMIEPVRRDSGAWLPLVLLVGADGVVAARGKSETGNRGRQSMPETGFDSLSAPPARDADQGRSGSLPSGGAPAAPRSSGDEEERLAFEAWAESEGVDTSCWMSGRPEHGYDNGRTCDYWTGWLARAALQAQALAPRDADRRALELAHEALIEAAECLRTDYPGCEDEWLNPIGIIVDHCETAIEAIEAAAPTGVPQDSEPTGG
jgi:hypothetical protein